MKRTLLRLVVCPSCNKKFRLVSFASNGPEIIDGLLKCNCSVYPIIAGIPRILPDYLRARLVNQHNNFFTKYRDELPKKMFNVAQNSDSFTKMQRKTAEDFGYEWTHFPEIRKVHEKQFLGWISPIPKTYLRNKLMLDAGCGKGRHTYFAAKYGAEVVGVDLSESVDVAYRNTLAFPKVHIIQADIYNLPFRKNTFDFVYCVGVLHHLPNPENGFNSVVEMAKRKGLVCAWVYGKEGNFLLKIMDPVRKYVISDLPMPFIKFISFSIMIFSHPIIKLIYKPLNSFSLTKPLASILPQNAFFYYLSNFNFRMNYSILFDQLLPNVAHYYKKEEFSRWFVNAKLNDIQIFWRNRNSWKGFGRKP